MPRSNFGPEVKAAMQGGTGARPPRSPSAQVMQQGRDSSGNTGLPPVNKMPGPGPGNMPRAPAIARGPVAPPGGIPAGGGVGLPGGGITPQHVAAAAGIANAILGNRGLR
jgi:hypothetical protein